jgi:endonuclease G
VWASAIICRESTIPYAKRAAAEESFCVDPDLPEDAQARPSHYTSSGYDRGHLIPWAAAAFDQTSSTQTYFMTNVFPQNPALNRGPWKSFEMDVRRWTTQHGRLAIVVGTAFAKRQKSIEGGVAIPSDIYAAVIALDSPGRPSMAVIVPNESPEKPSEKWASQFCVMPLDDLEKKVGTSIFRSLPWRHRPWFWTRREVDLKFWL